MVLGSIQHKCQREASEWCPQKRSNFFKHLSVLFFCLKFLVNHKLQRKPPQCFRTQNKDAYQLKMLPNNISEHFSVLSTLDNGNFDWYQEVAALWCLCCQALSLAFSPRCADVYKETSPAHIKGFKLSPWAVAMEITLLWSLIHVWLIVFSFLCCCLYKDLIMGTFHLENK